MGDRSALCIQPATVTFGGVDIGYTESGFEFYPEPQWDALFAEEFGKEPLDFVFNGYAAFGSCLLMEYKAGSMAAAFGAINSSKTATYPTAAVKIGMRATEISGATGALVVTPIASTANRIKLTLYNALGMISRGAAQRWAQRASVGIPVMFFALRDGSGNSWKEEPVA